MSSDSKAKKRFVGWQVTPVHQSTFGKTTRGGSSNEKANLIGSTGPVQTLEKQWYVLDASEVPVGRLATTAASILMGKHQATFTPGAGSGDHVIVINAGKAFFTSNKSEKKIYYRHTGYIGGLKMETAGEALLKHPEKVIHDAVYGMMPKSRLSAKQLRHLKVFHDDKHGMSAQQPISVSLKESGRALKGLGQIKREVA